MSKTATRVFRQFPDTPRGRIRRDTRRAVIAAKRAWVDSL